MKNIKVKQIVKKEKLYGIDGGRSERKLLVDCKKGAGGAGLMSGEVWICYKREVSQGNKVIYSSKNI